MTTVTMSRFVALFAREFDLEEDHLTRNTCIVHDLGFDSLELFRLMIFLEMLAPIDLPEDINLDDLTIGTVYDHYAAEAALL